jgi:hypothetical protein
MSGSPPGENRQSFQQKDADNKARIAERNRLAHVEAVKRRKKADELSAKLRRELRGEWR